MNPYLGLFFYNFINSLIMHYLKSALFNLTVMKVIRLHQQIKLTSQNENHEMLYTFNTTAWCRNVDKEQTIKK